MKHALLMIAAATMVLSACSFGHEYTTKGVPGYTSTGKPKSPFIKLGRAYSIKGRTYYPKHEPDYSEVGVASWYGPGFHGKSTANGERYDKHAMTAAHRTLPIPSIVRVTHRDNGKSIIVRVNDRGPFANNRIIDLSYEAAKRINMIGSGIAEVKVEYLEDESKTYMAHLIQGKHPNDINLAADVLEPVQYARARTTPAAALSETRVMPVNVADLTEAQVSRAALSPAPVEREESFWSILNPITEAFAAEPAPAPKVKTVATESLPPLIAPVPETVVVPQANSNAPAVKSPYDVLEQQQAPKAAAQAPISTGALPETPMADTPVIAAPPAAVAAPAAQAPRVLAPVTRYFVQVGAFSQKANIDAIERIFASDSAVERTPIITNSGTSLTRVRVGPITSRALADRVLAKAHANAMRDAQMVVEK